MREVTRKHLYNVLVTPIVIFVRAPLIIVLGLLVDLGGYAESASHWIADHVYGWRE